MSSLPPLVRDVLTGLLIVAAALLVVDMVGTGGSSEGRWVLLPVGAALFALRQGVRRAVTRRTGPEAAAPGAAGSASPSKPGARPGGEAWRVGRPATAPRAPRAPVAWHQDPVRVLGLAVLAVLALLVLAFYG